MTTHRMRDRREYHAWVRMRRACYNVTSNLYPTNGALGVTVCEEWKEDFVRFYYDMGPMPQECNGIARIDLNKGYDQENCYWRKAVGGRPINPAAIKKKKIIIVDSVTISFKIENKILELLKNLAIEESTKKGHLVEVQNIIRNILLGHFSNEINDENV